MNDFTPDKSYTSTIGGVCDFFMPIDRISYNISIYVDTVPQMTVELAMTDMVYANIRLRKIFDEYQAFQQRAREALEGLSIPYTKYRYGFFDRSYAESPTDSVNSLLGKHYSNSAGSEAFREGNGSFYRGGFGGRSRQWNDGPLYALERPLGEFDSMLPRSETPQQRRERQGSTRNSSQLENKWKTLDKESSKPWILRVWKYLSNNWAEMRIYLLFLFIFFALLALPRKQGRN
jgi:hypothetical protein